MPVASKSSPFLQILPLEIMLLLTVSIPRIEILSFKEFMIFPNFSLSNLLVGIESTAMHPGIWSSMSFLKFSKAFKIWSGLAFLDLHYWCSHAGLPYSVVFIVVA